MKAIEVIKNLSETAIVNENFKYCFMSHSKVPFTKNFEKVKVNKKDCFCKFHDLLESKYISSFEGVGISINESKVCAIDIDKCVSEPFNLDSINDFALEVINLFSDTYVEFSFSGKGIRILFYSDEILDYEKKYYIKNSSSNLEFYRPEGSNRYVSLTGKFILNNQISHIKLNKVIKFLEKYMRRKLIKIEKLEKLEEKPLDLLMKKVKYLLLTNGDFQDVWYTKAPGSNKDESERDFRLIKTLYSKITRNSEQIKKIFEQSEFFQSKDKKHIDKWTQSNYRYYYYILNKIKLIYGENSL